MGEFRTGRSKGRAGNRREGGEICTISNVMDLHYLTDATDVKL